jgi:hypothetical protein
MNHLTTLILLLSSFSNSAQTECEIAFVSDHYVFNNTTDTLQLSVDHRNQKSFPTEGPTVFTLLPESRTKVSSLEWAGEFRDPTGWYVMDFLGKDEINDPNNREMWRFEKTAETKGAYFFKVKND